MNEEYTTLVTKTGREYTNFQYADISQNPTKQREFEKDAKEQAELEAHFLL